MIKLYSLIFLSFAILVLANPDEITIEYGQTHDFNGYTIKLKSIKSDQAVISVNEDSAIFENGDEEEISGVKIKLNEIFYIGPGEGNVKLSVSTIYICGDKSCDEGETKESCCNDCGCDSGLICQSNECVTSSEIDKCNADADCDDSNPDTLDKCYGSPKQCSNIPTSICTQDSDCDDNNPCTDDKCTNEDCFNNQIENCTEAPSNNEEEAEETTNEKEETSLNNTEPEKQGFFSKIINFFKELFSWKVGE